MIRINRAACPNPAALAAGNYKHADNKEALRLSAHDKCMYCESKISHIDFADVEHIKPKTPGRYPELAYDWTNLGYACSRCNNEKGEKYHGDAPFIDPYSEDPTVHLFACGPILMQRNGSLRGEITIREIDLNRPALIEKRMQRIKGIQKALDACYRTAVQPLRQAALGELQMEMGADKEYSLVVKYLLQANAQQ